MIRGTTALLAHIGWPTHAFKAPLIYNPYFERAGIDAVVVPMGCRAEHYPAFLRAVFTLENIRGALITMPHKASTVACSTCVFGGADRRRVQCGPPRWRRPLSATCSTAKASFAACAQGLHRRGRRRAGRRRRRCRLGDRGVARGGRRRADRPLRRARRRGRSARRRLRTHYRRSRSEPARNDPVGFDIVVNATPLGMSDGDALPVDVVRIAPTTFVGEVVMKQEMTPFLKAARRAAAAFRSAPTCCSSRSRRTSSSSAFRPPPPTCCARWRGSATERCARRAAESAFLSPSRRLAPSRYSTRRSSPRRRSGQHQVHARRRRGRPRASGTTRR